MAGLSIGYGMNNMSGVDNGYMSRTDMIATAKSGDTSDIPSAELKRLKRTGAVECATCANRQYQDGSQENNVSFKSPGHIDPSASAGKVMAHESEHVSNAYKKAAKGDGQVINASVTLKTSICPECGRSYVAGGVTNTSIKYNESNPYGANQKAADKEALTGKNIDYAV